MRTPSAILIPLLLLCACAPAHDAAVRSGGDAIVAPHGVLVSDDGWTPCPTLRPGHPAAVCVGFGGNTIVADTSPPRLIMYREIGACQEFQVPDGQPGFRPSDVAVRGFFVYAIDETNRMLLRWDSSGSYRDVLLNFADLQTGRRVSPHGLDVGSSGRVAITDVENHKVIVFDTYLNIDVAFGNYGTFDGQFDTPLGVSFTPDGQLLVADSGNARLQLFTDSGAYRRTVPARGEDNPMRRPQRAVAAADGTWYVADPDARCVFVVAPGGTTIEARGPADTADFRPTDVALGRDGRLFVTDAATRSLRVFKVM